MKNIKTFEELSSVEEQVSETTEVIQPVEEQVVVETIEDQVVEEVIEEQVDEEIIETSEVTEIEEETSIRKIKTFEQFISESDVEMVDESLLGILSSKDKEEISNLSQKDELSDQEAQSIVSGKIFMNAVNQTRAIGSMAFPVEKIAAHRDLVIKEPIKYKQDILSTIKAADSAIKTGKKQDVIMVKGQDGLYHLSYKGANVSYGGSKTPSWNQ